MDIHITKLELLKTILEIDNEELIQKLAEIVKKENSDFWAELNLAERKEITKGIEQLEQGKRISYESFLTKIS